MLTYGTYIMEPIIPQPENTQREGVAPSDMAPSISEAALLYQQTMATTPPTATTLAAQPMEPVKDVVMTDSIMDGASVIISRSSPRCSSS